MTAEWEFWGMFGIVVLVSNLCYMALVLSGQLNQHRLQAMEALKNHQCDKALLNLPPEPLLAARPGISWRPPGWEGADS